MSSDRSPSGSSECAGRETPEDAYKDVALACVLRSVSSSSHPVDLPTRARLTGRRVRLSFRFGRNGLAAGLYPVLKDVKVVPPLLCLVRFVCRRESISFLWRPRTCAAKSLICDPPSACFAPLSERGLPVGSHPAEGRDISPRTSSGRCARCR